jgi:hypothetical protein
MNQLLAFHGEEKIKDKYVKRVKAHYKADEIVQGQYWENGKGCAVGCTIQTDDVKNSHGSWHQRYEEALGVPRVLARLEDRIFEGLTNGEAKEFPLKFIEAIHVGADLTPVFYQFMHWLLVDPKEGVIKYARPDGKKAIKNVAKLLKRKLEGGSVTSDEWYEVREAAWSALRADAAYAAYAAAAADAAAAAAAAAADAAADAYAADAAADAYAADAAAYAAAAGKARSARYSKMAKKLIALLKAAK